jgi:hypothetical protein
MVATRSSTKHSTKRRSTTRRLTTRRLTTGRSTKSHSLNSSIMKKYAENLRKRGKNKKERLNELKQDMLSVLKKLKENPKNAKTVLNKTDAGKFILNLAKMVEKKKKNSTSAGARVPEGYYYSDCSIFTMALITVLFVLTMLGLFVESFHNTCEEHNITRTQCEDTLDALVIVAREIFGVIMMFVD